MAKIKYTCKNCGWETSIREEWADLKPKRCMNRKCNTSFIVKPSDLLIEKPTPVVTQETTVNKTHKNVTKNKRQEASKADE